MNLKEITFNVNNKDVTVLIDPRETLQEVLRNRLHLTGLKIGCGVGECGACTVLVDDLPIDSCLYMAMQVAGKKVMTVEGLEREHGKLSDVQKAFIAHGAVQCGFCTTGLVMTATHLKETGKTYSREEIRREIAGNLCRCTGYSHVIDAIESVVGKKQ